MGSYLEVLVFIPAPSHSAANRSSESWRSRPDEANRTTSSAKSRDPILKSPNQTPSTPWLRLEIMSLEVMNKMSYKEQPRRSPTLTGNESDLLPADQAHTPVIQGVDRQYQGAQHPIVVKNPQKESYGDMVKYLLQVHKTHVNWLGKFPPTLKDPAEGPCPGPKPHCSSLIHDSASWQALLSSILERNRPCQGGGGVWFPYSWNTHFGPLSKKKDPQSANPVALPLMSMRCWRAGSANAALQHPEF